MIALLSVALAEPVVQLERVDLFSEQATGFWIDDVPRLGVGPRVTGLRWAEQVSVAVDFPRASVVLETSLARQSLRLRRPLSHRFPVYVSGAVITHLGLPAGAGGGAEVWLGPLRLGGGLYGESRASWARPTWDHWRLLPGIGVGLGRSPMRF